MEYYNVQFIKKIISSDLEGKLLNYCHKNFNDHTNIRSCHLYGDAGLVYKTIYQNKVNYSYAINWNEFEDLLIVKQQLENIVNVKFNFCAIMMYANENVVIKKHRDKEMKGQSIYGLSLGATRRLQLTHKNLTNILELTSGSLYIISNITNNYWLHEILPESHPTDVRFSLTFRYVENAMHVNDIIYCKALLKSGKRKGCVCDCIAYEGHYCGKHKTFYDGYQQQLLNYK